MYESESKWNFKDEIQIYATHSNWFALSNSSRNNNVNIFSLMLIKVIRLKKTEK